MLSCSPGAEQLEPAKSIAVCQATNAALYELTRAHPGRLFGSAILPVKDVAAAERELERCVKEYGFVSWHTHSNYGNTAPDDPRYLPSSARPPNLASTSISTLSSPRAAATQATALPLPVPVLALRWIRSPRCRAWWYPACSTRFPLSGWYWDTWARGFLCCTVLKTGSNFCPIRPFARRRPLRYYFQHNIWVTTSGNMSPEASSAVPRMC